MKLTLTPGRRRWLYRVTSAVLAALVIWRVLDGQQSAALLLIVSAVLGVADAHVPSGEDA